MGNVRLGPPENLVLALKAISGIATFCETGTYKGQTTRWALQRFANVITIEGYEPRYRKTRAAIEEDIPTSQRENLVLALGDSRQHLAKMINDVWPGPSIIWLDAHWCGEGAHDCNGDECPLMEEIEAINASLLAAKHIILIDDARLFQSPPPYPHDPKQWPNIVEVLRALGCDLDSSDTPNRIAVIHEDVIAATPPDPIYNDLLNAWSVGFDIGPDYIEELAHRHAAAVAG